MVDGLTNAVRALVVENDLASRELLARVLRLRGVEAQTSVGLAQAARGLQSADAPYDLLVLDLNLEPVDGTELLRQVASLPASRWPARIVVIGEVSALYPKLAELQLPLEMFQKPVHLPSLIKVVDALKGDEPRQKAE